MKKLIYKFNLYLKGSYCDKCYLLKDLPEKSNIMIGYRLDGVLYEYWCESCYGELKRKETERKEEWDRLIDEAWLKAAKRNNRFL